MMYSYKQDFVVKKHRFPEVLALLLLHFCLKLNNQIIIIIITTHPPMFKILMDRKQSIDKRWPNSTLQNEIICIVSMGLCSRPPDQKSATVIGLLSDNIGQTSQKLFATTLHVYTTCENIFRLRTITGLDDWWTGLLDFCMVYVAIYSYAPSAVT